MFRQRQIILLIGTCFLILFLSGAAQAAQIVSTIEINEATMEAEVGPGQSGLVQFTGIVKCEGIGVGNNVQRILFSLHVDAAGWSASVSPSTMAFSPTETEKTFRLSVRAPPRTSYLMTQEVTITGSATPVPGIMPVDVNPATAMVLIKQFYKVMLSSTSPYVELAPGNSHMFKLTVHNQGNGLDTFTIDILNQKKMADLGWVVHVSTSSVDIEENGEQDIKIQVTTPTKWTIWKNEISAIEVQVTSQGSQRAGVLVQTEEYPFYCREKGMYIPGFNIELMLIAMIIPIAIIARNRARR